MTFFNASPFASTFQQSQHSLWSCRFEVSDGCIFTIYTFPSMQQWQRSLWYVFLGWTSAPWLYNLLSTNDIEMSLTLEVIISHSLPCNRNSSHRNSCRVRFEHFGAYTIQVNFSKISHSLVIGRSSCLICQEQIRHPGFRHLCPVLKMICSMLSCMVIVANFPPQSVREIAWKPRNTLVFATPNAAARSLTLTSLVFWPFPAIMYNSVLCSSLQMSSKRT